jgi:hypothetical protein
MRRILHTEFLGPVFIISTTSAPALAELDDLAARHVARECVAKRTGNVGHCMKTRRKEEWEEDLFRLRLVKVLQGKLNEDLFIYEVVDVGCYRLEDSSLMIETIDHPGTWGYVAVNKRTEKTYRLWSDQDATSEFNRLIVDLGVSATDDSAARGMALLYRQIVSGPYKGNTVYSDLEIKRLAEDSFDGAYLGKDSSQRFSKWWTRFKKTKEISYREETKKTPKGYEVRGKAFEGFALTVPRTKASGHPRVSEWILEISPNGTVQQLPSQLVFE